MRIALDYDGTYTRAPSMWDQFIALAREHGHEVVCITQRFPDEEIVISCPVIYTSRQTKGQFVVDQMPEIWIDDMPHRIFERA